MVKTYAYVKIDDRYLVQVDDGSLIWGGYVTDGKLANPCGYGHARQIVRPDDVPEEDRARLDDVVAGLQRDGYQLRLVCDPVP
jgi:hypothetical protein